MPRLLRTLALVAAVAVAAPAAARAQTAPNLSGTWELDVAQSSFGMMPPPTKSTIVVEQKETAFKTVTTSVTQRGERTATMSYTLDGKESRNTSAQGTEVTSVVTWDGPALAIASKTSMQGNDVTIGDRWSLSADGRTLTVTRKIAAPMGEMEQKLVYVKKD